MDVIATLARLSSAEAAAAIPKGSAQFVLGEAVVALPLGDVIDFAKERARLEKDLKKAEDEIARFDAKLSNEQFVAKAPEEVLAEQREKRAEAAGPGGAPARSGRAAGRITLTWRRGCRRAGALPNSSTSRLMPESPCRPCSIP